MGWVRPQPLKVQNFFKMFKNAENWPFSLHKFSKYERSSQMSKSNFELSNLNLGRLVIKTFERFSWHWCLDKNAWGSMILGKFLILQCTRVLRAQTKQQRGVYVSVINLGCHRSTPDRNKKYQGKLFCWWQSYICS